MKKFKVRVPATTANLGAGYDTIGIALDLFNDFIFSFDGEGIEFIDVEERFANNDHLVYTTFCDLLEKHGVEKPKGFRLEVVNKIPVARGLGSSSTCIVAGLLAANEYGELGLSKEDLMLEACLLEGHPDNVIPAIVGNMAGGLIVNDKVLVQEINVPCDFRFYAFVEPFESKTSDARAVIPSEVSHQDAIFNVQRAALLMRAFENRLVDQLGALIDDKLHEPYRRKLVKRYYKIENFIEDDCFVANWISGAGSTMMALGLEGNLENIESVVSNLDDEIKLYRLNVCKEGAKIEYM